MWNHPDIVELRRKVREIEEEWASAPRGKSSEIRERHRLALNAIRDRMAELKTSPRSDA